MWVHGAVADGPEVTMLGFAITRGKKFRYLGSIIEEKGDIDKDINQCIRVDKQKWKNASRVLYDKKIPMELKVNFCRM